MLQHFCFIYCLFQQNILIIVLNILISNNNHGLYQFHEFWVKVRVHMTNFRWGEYLKLYFISQFSLVWCINDSLTLLELNWQYITCMINCSKQNTFLCQSLCATVVPWLVHLCVWERHVAAMHFEFSLLNISSLRTRLRGLKVEKAPHKTVLKCFIVNLILNLVVKSGLNLCVSVTEGRADDLVLMLMRFGLDWRIPSWELLLGAPGRVLWALSQRWTVGTGPAVRRRTERHTLKNKALKLPLRTFKHLNSTKGSLKWKRVLKIKKKIHKKNKKTFHKSNLTEGHGPTVNAVLYPIVLKYQSLHFNQFTLLWTDIDS